MVRTETLRCPDSVPAGDTLKAAVPLQDTHTSLLIFSKATWKVEKHN